MFITSSLVREQHRNQVRGKQARLAGYHARDAQLQTNARRHTANQRFRKILPDSQLSPNYLRLGKYRRTRQARLRKDRRAELASPRNIAKRPKHIESRRTYGHWEGDTIHGAGKTGYIATFVERKHRCLKSSGAIWIGV